MQKLISLIAIICLASIVACKYECTIPGWPNYYQNTYTTKCGYLGDPIVNYNYHYVYVNKSLTIRNPLIIKIGGGPGESSKVGLFEEYGPYLWDSDGNFDEENEFTWSQKSHLLFIDAPQETGYSYLLGGASPSIYTDDDTAAKVAAAISQFLNDAEYSILKNGRIFLQGQDTAALVIPKIADILMQKKGIDIEGLMLGSPILSVQDNCDSESDRLPNTTISYFLNREYFSPQLKRIWSTQQACQRSDYASPRCKYLINRIHAILDGINIYNINNDCQSDVVTKKSTKSSKNLKNELKPDCYPICRKEKSKNVYLNDSAHIVAFNAAPLATSGRDGYSIFNYETFGLYSERSAGTEKVMDVLARLILNDTFVIIYSGLNDADISHLLVELYVDQLATKIGAYSEGLKQFNCTALSEEKDNPPLGGWSQKYSYGDGGFVYLRVLNAGRWVSADYPEAGYEIMERSVSETDPW
eukprot:TRINITY_DN2268_c0_g1_i1.p1 TRINITY_DN2268_c0_g1~~TRINITY_DN2268_c0_g1_i1.p1  ORF type:complete len:471 (+),score=74.32 TRINITY_DN2268_c0_g1_i1:147-1559(+)